jgi:opacity protein-like surface antigen
MRMFFLVFAAVCFSACASTAHAQVEIFGGYSYLRPSLTYTETPTACPVVLLGCPAPAVVTTHPNLNGWELTGVFNVYHWIGLAADFGGNYGSVRGASTHANTYLFGPQIRLPGPVSPFAHGFIGAAHEKVEGVVTNDGFLITPESSNALAAAVGAGLDIKVLPLLSVRPIQLDYLVTRFRSGTQSQPRASAGLTIRF